MSLDHFIRKKESCSAHFAWGALLGLLAALLARDPIITIPLTLFLGVTWEGVTCYLSGGSWIPSKLDVIPWVVGGIVALVLARWIL